jgi:hypothetical protein
LLTALTPPGQISGGYFSGLEPRLNAETPGFYEADYVKSRVKHFFSLSLVSFIPKLATTLFSGFGV